MHASTIVDADITTNTTWDISGSPYIISTDIFISEGATLTIGEGVIVKFDYGTQVVVLGQIVATGSSNSPLVFTSLYDDSIRGDDDGIPDTTGSPTDYVGFVFNGGSTGEFSYILMKYSLGGMSVENASLSISTSQFIDNYGGIDVIEGTFSVLNSSFENSDTPVRVDMSVNFTHAGNTFTNNTNNGFLTHGELTSGTYTFLGGDAPYIISDYISIYSSASVTISPGAVMQSDWNGGGFDVSGGILQINGEASNRVILEDIDIDGYYDGQVNINYTDIRRGIINAYYEGEIILDNILMDVPRNTPITVYLDGMVQLNNSEIKNTQIYRDVVAVFSDGIFSMSNSTLDGGGEGVDVFSHGVATIDHSVIKNMSDSAVIAYGRVTEPENEITITYTEMTGNYIGLFPDGNTNITATNNSIHDNTYGAYEYRSLFYDFPNNWWGDATGPYKVDENESGLGNEVSGPILFTPWLTRNPLLPRRTPVLIVPGVLGTEIEKPSADGPIKLWFDFLHNITDIGDQFMDALMYNDDLTPVDDSLYLLGVIRNKGVVFDYTNGLIEELTSQGYIENEDIFTLPYDWRFGVNNTNVDALASKINEIRTLSGLDSVDIIAHSTGGLLVKKYVIDRPLTHHIRKAVFVGVPNTGAPKALKALLAGDNFDIPSLSQKEMKKLARNFPVVYDLLPSREYYNQKGSYFKTIDRYLRRVDVKNLTYDEVHDLLVDGDHDLNATALTQSEALHTNEFDNFDLRTVGVDIYAIDGCRAYTPVKVTEIHNHILGGMSYVMPSVHGGDGTVPLESSTNLPIDESHKYYARNASHAKMMGQNGIREQIVNILSGSTLTVSSDDITQDISRCNLNGRAFAVYSPVAISVTDSLGNYAHVSSDGDMVENTISNSGFELWDDHKFVYLPTDDGQTYTVQLQGTGTGFFTLTDATILNGEASTMQVYTHIPVTQSMSGILSFSGVLSVDTDGDTTIDTILSPDKSLSTQDIPDFDPTYTEQENSNTTSQSGRGHGHPVENKKMADTEMTLFDTNNQETVLVENNKSFNLNIENGMKGNLLTEKRENSEIIEEPQNLTANAITSGLKPNSRVLLTGMVGLAVVVYWVTRKKII